MALTALRLIVVLGQGDEMRDDAKDTSSPQTERASHWLHDEPGTFDAAVSEAGRLQKTLLILIAADALTEGRAEKAYEIAGWA